MADERIIGLGQFNYFAVRHYSLSGSASMDAINDAFVSILASSIKTAMTAF
jgi:hypothetical protein